MQSSGVFIYRSPSDESLDVVRNTQKKLSAIESFRPVEAPHITLLRSKLSAHISDHALRHIVFPLPESAEQPSRLRVDSVILRSFYISRLAITLHLEDTEGLFHSEHTTFAHRLAQERRLVPVIGDPHLTLGHIDPEFAIDQQLSELTQDIIGVELQFKGIELSRDIVNPLPSPKAETRVIPVANSTVKIMRPNSMPASFLATLRKKPDEQ